MAVFSGRLCNVASELCSPLLSALFISPRLVPVSRRRSCSSFYQLGLLSAAHAVVTHRPIPRDRREGGK